MISYVEHVKGKTVTSNHTFACLAPIVVAPKTTDVLKALAVFTQVLLSVLFKYIKESAATSFDNASSVYRAYFMPSSHSRLVSVPSASTVNYLL